MGCGKKAVGGGHAVWRREQEGAMSEEESIEDQLRLARRDVAQASVNFVTRRERALALTKLDEAIMWFTRYKERS